TFNNGTTVAFGSGKALLVLEPSSHLTGPIVNFHTGITIDLAGTVANSETYANDVLTLKNGPVTVSTLQLPGNFNTTSFLLSPDGSGGTDITLLPNSTPFASLLGHGKSDLLMQDVTGALVADEDKGGQIDFNPFGSFNPPWQFEGFGDFF